MPPSEISRLIEQRLAELREHPELLTRWDLNRDGELDEREWDLVRRMVEHEVETAQKRGESPSAAFEPEILNDRYEVVGLLGRGGQAETFLALDRENDNQHVVAKVLEIKVAADWKSIELFEREAKVLERLEHPRIPAYIDHFHLDGQHATRFVIIQQFIDGEDLGKLVESGKTWTSAEAMARLGELAEILTYLHELGPPVVHRDIKPSNIIHGRDDHLYLVDFGAAQNIVPATVGGSTIIGTSGYVPMEQYMGRASPASDIYGLGATIVHLVSGKHPADMDLDRGRLRFEKYFHDAELVALLESMLAHLEDRVPSGEALKRALVVEQATPVEALAVRAHRSLSVHDPETAVVRWHEQIGQGFVQLHDATRPWLAVYRRPGSITRAVGHYGARLELTATPWQLTISVNRSLMSHWLALTAAGAVIAGLAVFAGADALLAVFGALLAVAFVVIVHSTVRSASFEFTPSQWRDAKKVGRAPIERFEVTESNELIVHLSGQSPRVLTLQPMPQEARDYILAVITDAHERFKREEPLDIVNPW